MPDNILPIQPIETPILPGYHSNDNYSKPVEIADPSSTGMIATKDPIEEGFSKLSNAKSDLYAPKQFDYDKANADEFVGTKNYKALGYDPDLGDVNELKYHQAQSTIDVIGDTVRGFGNKLGNGFVDLAAGWKNTASLLTAGGFGNTFKQDEIEQAQQLQQARENKYHIYTDPTDRSYLSWDGIAKGIQDAGGIVGAGAEIVAEQLAIDFAIATTFGGAAPLEGLSTAKNALALGELTTESAKLVNTLDKTANLKNAYNAFKESQEVGTLLEQTKSALKVAGSATSLGADAITEGFATFGKNLLPGGNSIGAIASGGLKDAIQSKNAGAVIASLGRGFGAFYNDVRDVNLAVSMGQGSASGTYQKQLQELTEQYKHQNGDDPVGTDLKDLQDKAYQAAKTSGAFNALSAFYLNKLAFGNLLTGSKVAQEALLSNAPGEFSNLVRTTTEKELKETGDRLIMKDATWDTFRARAMRQLSPKNLAETGKSMLGHGVGFGLINNTQSAIDEAVHSYYSAKYNNKAISASDAIQKGIDSQFTTQGAKSFISGIVTGAIVSPLMEVGGQAIEHQTQRSAGKVSKPTLPENATEEQKSAYAAQKTYYQQRTNPELSKKATPEEQSIYNEAKSYATNGTTPQEPAEGEDKSTYNKILETKKHIEDYTDYQNRKKTAAEEYVNKVNQMWKNPLPSIGDVILQSQWNEKLTGGLVANDKKEAEDAISDSGITLLVNAAQNGMIKPYLEHLEDKISQLSPQELWDAIYSNVPPSQKPEFTEQGYSELQQKIQDFKDRAADISKIYANLLKQFPAAINPNQYALGSGEREAAQKQYDQHLRALGLLSYYKSSIVDKVERQSKILNGDNVSGGIQEHLQGMPFFNVKSFASVPDMTEQIELLKTLTSSERIPGNDKAYQYTAEMGGKLRNYRDTVQEYIDKYNKILDINDDIERKESLKELNEYHHEIFQPLLKDLINNKLLDLDPTGRNRISDRDTLSKVTKGYMDYHLLSAEHDNMLDTVNKVLDPNGKHNYFRSFITAEDNAMMWEAYKAGKKQPVSKPVDITPKETEPVTQDIPHEDVTNETVTPEPEQLKPVKVDTNKIKDEMFDLLQHSYGEDDEEQGHSGISSDLQKYMETPEGKDLGAKMDAVNAVIDNKAISADEKNKQLLSALKSVISEHFDKNQSLNEYSNLKGNPHVIKLKEDDYRTVYDGKQGTETHLTAGLANNALNELINKEHPSFAVGEQTYRKNQFLYDDNGHGHLLYTRKGIPYIDNHPTDEEELSKFHTEKPLQEITQPSPEPGKDYQKITNLRNQVSIYPHSSIGQEGLSKLIRETPDVHNAITLIVSRGPRAGETRTVGEGDKINPYVIQNREPWSIQMNINGKPAGFITTGLYSFTFDGKSVSVPNLTVDQFKKVYVAHNGDYEKALQLFKEDNANAQSLITAVREYMKNKSTAAITGKQLEKFVDFIPSGKLDFINESEEKVNRSTLQKLQETGTKIVSILDNRTGEVVYGNPTAHLSIQEAPSVYGNYRGIIRQVNGQQRWIEVQGKRYTEQETNDILSQVTTSLESMKELEGKELTAAKKTANKLLSKIFVAIDPGPSRIIIEPQVAISKGQPIFQVSYKFRDGSPIQGIPDAKVLSINENDFTALETKDVNQFAKAIESTLNRFFVKKGGEKAYEVSIKPDSFRQSFPSNFDEETAMQLQSSVNTDITKDNYMMYKTKSSTIPEEVIPTINDIVPEEIIESSTPGVVFTAPDKKGMSASFSDLLAAEDITGAFDDLIDNDAYIEKISDLSPGHEIISIEELKDFLSKTIPEGLIDVQEVDSLIQKLQSGHTTVGQFLTHINTLGAKGTIQTSENAPYKYHEALHGIMRLLLSDSEIDKLLKEAKKENPITQEQINKFLEERPRFIGADKKTIEDRIAEEFIADKFEDWKKDHKTPGSQGMKNFFAKLWEWIKSLFNRIKGDRLEAFFYDINRGVYKKAKLANNRFTGDADITEPAQKVIEIGTQKVIDPSGKEITVPRTLDSQTSHQITSAVAALYIQYVKAEPYSPREVVLNKMLDMYKNMLYPKQDRYIDQVNSIKNPAQKEQFMKDLVNRYQIFNLPKARESVLESVNATLKTMGLREQIETDKFEDLENSETRERGYDKVADEIGGYEDIPKEIKLYIGSTTFPYTDEFGNTELVRGTPLVQAVNGGTVYNGLLQTLEGCVTDNDIIQRLQAYRFSKSNPDTSAFINRLFIESGFSDQGDNKWTITKNQSLFQSVINTFKQYNTNALFGEISPAQGSSRVYSANQQDSAKTQFSQWSQAHAAVYLPGLNNLNSKEAKSKYAKEALQPTFYAIKDHITTKKAQGTAISDDSLSTTAQKISNELKDRIGIAISPDMIAFSIVSGKDGEILTDNQKQLLNAYRGKSFITVEDIDGIRDSMLSGDNIFNNKEGEQEGAANRLLKLAQANIPFDQSVWTMSYTDPEGKTRWGLQKPTYNRQTVQKLNDDQYIAELQNNPDTQSSYLLENDDFLTLSNRNLLKVYDISGLKQVYHNLTEGEEGIEAFTNLGLEVNKAKGASFKHLSARDLQAFNIASYGSPTRIQNSSEKGDYFYTTPATLGIIAESATNNMVNLPVIHTIDTNSTGESKLSQDAVNILVNKAINEIDKIQRVKKEIATLPKTELIQDYHDGTLRGLKIIDTRKMLGDTLSDEIEKGVQEDGYVPDTKSIEKQIKLYWGKKINNFIKNLEKEGLVKLSKDKLENRLLPDFVFNGFQTKNGSPIEEKNEKMNLIEGNAKHNLAQIYMNNYLNSTAVRQLLYRDSSKGWKNVISTVRSMMKGANNAGESLEFSVTAPDLGIDHPLPVFHHALIPDFEYTTPTGEVKDETDGQMYTTVKGLRYSLFGFGELTKTQANILDAIEKGSNKAEEMFIESGGLKRWTEAFDPKKIVYADGQTHFKCTVLMLTKELTSYKSGSKWLPLPGRENLHHLRESMEAFENKMELEGKPTISFTSTANSSKGLKYQTAPDIQAIHQDYFHELPSANMRQVLKLGSNKLEMTDPNGLKFNVLTEQDHSSPAPWLDKTIGEVAKEYLKDSAQRSTNSYHGIINSLFKTKSGKPIRLGDKVDLSDTIPDLGTVTDQMKSTQEATGSDSQILDLLTTRDGEQVYNWNLSPVLPKTTQMFLSYLGNGPLKEKVPGLSLVMASGYGMQVIRELHSLDDNGQPKTWTIHTNAMFKSDPEQYNDIIKHSDSTNKTYQNLPDPSKQKVYVLDGLKHNYPEYDKDGKFLGYFTECIRPAHYSDESWGKVVPAVQNMVGTRIPWDDKHQAVVLKTVDILPAYYGSIVICPGMIDHTSGSDKDGDKQFGAIQDTYIKNGERVPYGTAVTDEEKFGEYKLWQKNNNKLFKRLYNADKLYLDKEAIAIVLNDKDANDFRAEQVLKQLRLPSTLSEFIKEGAEDLNNGVLNNRIFNKKIALLSNEHISGGGKDAIINQATNTSPVKNLLDPENENSVIAILRGKGIDDESPIMKQLLGEDIDINTIDGGAKMMDIAHEGKEDVGAAIISVMTGGLLQQYNIHGEGIAFDGKSYNSFGDTQNSTGIRKLSETSALANTMTDNLKDGGTAAKLGLTIDAVGIIGTMVMQGIPLKSAIWYTLQPVVQEYFKQMKELNSTLKTAEERARSKSTLLDNMLEKLGKEIPNLKGGNFDNLTEDKLIDAIVDGGKDIKVQYSALRDIATIRDEVDTLSSMNKIMQLSKGLPASWEDFDKLDNALEKIGIVYNKESGSYVPINDKAFQLSGIPIDVREVFTNKHDIYKGYLQQVAQEKELSKKLFLERTDTFRRVYDIIGNNFDVRQENKDDFNKEVKQDLISYLSILTNINSLKNDGGYIGSLRQSLIYDKDGEENIKDIVTRLRSMLTGKNTNMLLSKFLRLIVPGEEGNRDNLYKLTSNTWAKLSEAQQQNLQDSFYSLYTNTYKDKNGKTLDTRNDALTLFHYLLVKDGAQFKSGSFIKIVPTFLFKDLSDSTQKVLDLLSNEDYTDQKATDTFGIPYEQLLNNFMKSYSSHKGNEFFVKGITIKQGIPVVIPDDTKDVDWNKVKEHLTIGDKPIKFDSKAGNLTLNLFKGIRDNKSVEIGTGIVSVEKGKKFTPTEKQMLNKNIKYLESAGFSVEGTKEGYKIHMPFSVKIQGNRYELKQVGKIQAHGTPTRVIEKGENIPQGISGWYQKAPWYGSEGQWKGAIYGLFGDPKEATIIPGTEQISNPGYSPSSPARKEVTADIKTESKGILKTVRINLQPDNIKKINEGTKKTTIRGTKQMEEIGLKPNETGLAKIGNQTYKVTNRGLISIYEAGGKEAMVNSEGLKSEEDFMFKQSKDWVNGKGKLWVYDITPTSEIISSVKALADTGGFTAVDKKGNTVSYNDQGEAINTQKEPVSSFSSLISDVSTDVETYEDEDLSKPSIDWKSQTELIWKSKKLPADKKTEWLEKARGVYTKMKGKVPDNEIIESIKKCI